jgi:ribosomal-protein-alanine N-acetyltransferase
MVSGTEQNLKYNEDRNGESELTFRDGYDPAWIDQVMSVHNKTEMGRAPEFKSLVNDAFTSSFAVTTAWLGSRMIGCGRMISDGKMYSGIFDVVVDPEYQKRGVGRKIMEGLVAKASGTCIHLTSTFGNEAFYHKIGFKKHKTAMALYPDRMTDSPYLDSDWKPVPPTKKDSEFPQPRLETDRLMLERYTDADLNDIFAYASNPEVTKMLTWPPHKTLDDSKAFLEWVQASTNHRPGNLFFVFAIRLKSTGRVIGSIDFKNPQPWIGQIDYVLSRDHWGKGLMPEAARALRDWSMQAFPDMIRFQAYCEPENAASARVMQKVGMTFEGVRRQTFKVKGKIVDLAHYALIREIAAST